MFWLILLTSICLALYKFTIKPLFYWKEKGVPYLTPVPIFGNLLKVVMKKQSPYNTVTEFYNEFPNLRYNGTFQFNKPTLLIRDLELIKRVCVKDFDHFTDRRDVGSSDLDPLFAKTISRLHGQEWRNMRSVLSPAFTSSKIKGMFALITECAEQMADHFANRRQGSITEIQVKDLFTRYTNDVIATCAFGVKCDSLLERDNEFFMMGKDLSSFSGARAIKFLLANFSPIILKVLNLSVLPAYLTDFFLNTIKETISYRIKNDIIRPDMIHLLMEARRGTLRHDANADDPGDCGFAVIEESDVGKQYKFMLLSDLDIAAQAFNFFFAGFDTSSTALCFASTELAINPDIQQKLFVEIDEVMKKCNGKPSYEVITRMKYMDMVLSETLRKWPATPITNRKCTKPYTIKATTSAEVDCQLDLNDNVLIPIIGIHRDERYYPEPEKFDPERFSDENKHKIKSFSYLPFGVGPRACIDYVRSTPRGDFNASPLSTLNQTTTQLIDKMLFVILFVIIVAIYWKVIRPRRHWTRLGIKQIMFGGYFKSNLKLNSFPEVVQYIYEKTSTSRYLGIYQFFNPLLVIKDVNLIRQLTVKDFDYFTDHLSIMPDEDYEPLWSKNLFVLKGQKWRDMRATLSPAFTSSKMKAMFNLMNDCAKKFVKNFESADTTTVELKDVFTRYSNDVIATCAFGVQCDSMAAKDNEFYKMGKEATNFAGFWKSIQFSILFGAPKLGKLLGLTVLSRRAAAFFENLVRDTVSVREEKKIFRPDMINLLMEARNGRLKYEENPNALKETGFATVEESSVGIKTEPVPKEKLTMLDMTAQAFIFFFAGFDSISTAMCFMGYELAINPDIQQRLFEEIEETSNECGGDVTYEALNKMKYFDMIVAETLRKWPNAVAVDRVCTKPYTIEPESDSEVPLTLEKGSGIWIPIWGLHRDPQHYPKPEVFDPERFSDENKGNIKPYTYLPFGSGPRNCIGSRFALLEAKAVFFHLLSKFEIVVVDKTEIPLTLSTRGFVLAPASGFWLGFKQR